MGNFLWKVLLNRMYLQRKGAILQKFLHLFGLDQLKKQPKTATRCDIFSHKRELQPLPLDGRPPRRRLVHHRACSISSFRGRVTTWPSPDQGGTPEEEATQMVQWHRPGRVRWASDHHQAPPLLGRLRKRGPRHRHGRFHLEPGFSPSHGTPPRWERSSWSNSIQSKSQNLLFFFFFLRNLLIFCAWFGLIEQKEQREGFLSLNRAMSLQRSLFFVWNVIVDVLFRNVESDVSLLLIFSVWKSI